MCCGPRRKARTSKNQEKTKRVYSERVFLSGNIKWINFLHAVAFEKRSDFFQGYRLSYCKFCEIFQFDQFLVANM